MTAPNPSLLVSAAMLQDYLVDKDTGLPLAAGVITMYQDNARTTLKNWYYQSGVAGAYTYLPLANPLTLSASGTITDPNGNDTIPFYYPVDETNPDNAEPYYVTVDNSNGERQFSRQNFPFEPPGQSPDIVVPTYRNYLINNGFWRNIGSVNATNLTTTVIAPSQHEGYLLPTANSTGMADIQFIKSKTGATDTITFNTFGAGVTPLTNDITPEYYLNVTCSAATTGETSKYIQIPISLHVNTLQNVNATLVIWTQNNGGTSADLTVGLYQFLGTGISSPALPVLETISVNSGWNKSVINFTFPITPNSPLGGGGDDAWFLQINYPLNATFNINIAKPQLYLSKNIPTNDFDTYDQVETIFNSPRTGDVRTSINSFSPYGWVPMNDGTIGNALSNATARKNTDTWPLFNMIWQYASPFASGSSNPIAQIFTSGGAATTYGASAIADFNANKAIALTKSMGKVILGTVPLSQLLTSYSTLIAASNSAGTLLISTGGVNVNFFNGMPVTFATNGGSLPDALTANTVYYVAAFNGSNQFFVSTSFANAMAGTYVAYGSTNGSLTIVSGATQGATEGEYAHTQLAAELATHHHSYSAIGVGSGIGNGFNFVNVSANTGATGNSTPFNVTQPGTFYNIFIKL